MQFVGGDVQGEFVEQVRGRDPERCLVVPIDVGKRQAEVLVADLYGQVVAGPLTVVLDRPGVAALLAVVDDAISDRSGVFCRFGVESCGHYHRLLTWQLVADGRDVVELNPGHVKQARAGQGRRRVKTDQTDLAAMASLLIQGGGRAPRRRSDAVAVQRIWVAHRDRQVTARIALSNQIQGLVDQVFPSLTDCYASLLSARSARVIIANMCDPDRIRGLGAKRLRTYVVNRGVAMTRPKAAQVEAAAKVSLRLPEADRTALQTVLTGEIGRYDQLCASADDAEREMGAVLADTPAAVLTSLPGVSVVRASAYGAALGDPGRYPNATAAYRTAGLAPAQHSSAGSTADGQSISREGRRELRTAVVQLGKGLARYDDDFGAYKAALVARHKPRKVVNIAVGRRAHRLAFAMMRDQTVYDPAAWRAGVAAGRTVMDDTWSARCDVAAPPPDSSMTPKDKEHNPARQLVGA